MDKLAGPTVDSLRPGPLSCIASLQLNRLKRMHVDKSSVSRTQATGSISTVHRAPRSLSAMLPALPIRTHIHHTHNHTPLIPPTHTRAHTRTHTHTHIHIHTYTHTRIHTHAHASSHVHNFLPPVKISSCHVFASMCRGGVLGCRTARERRSGTTRQREKQAGNGRRVPLSTCHRCSIVTQVCAPQAVAHHQC